MHCWLEYKLEQILGDRVWHFFKMLNIELLYDLCVCVKLLQSCLTLCNLMDCNPPGFSIHGILQARILQWISL